MSFSLLPDLIFPALTDLTPQLLQQRGITYLMMDFDNTIVPYSANAPTEQVLQWLKAMQASSIGLCIVSNSHKPRVQEFCSRYRLSCVTHAKKPFSKGLLEAKWRYQIDFSHAALVGDQIFTDVLGANCAGLTSILVKPIHLSNIWLRLRNWAEQPFILLGKWGNRHG